VLVYFIARHYVNPVTVSALVVHCPGRVMKPGRRLLLLQMTDGRSTQRAMLLCGHTRRLYAAVSAHVVRQLSAGRHVARMLLGRRYRHIRRY